MTFSKGQPVIYMRRGPRCAGSGAKEISAVYVEEMQFSYRERRHHIVIQQDGRKLDRWVGLESIRPA